MEISFPCSHFFFQDSTTVSLQLPVASTFMTFHFYHGAKAKQTQWTTYSTVQIFMFSQDSIRRRLCDTGQLQLAAPLCEPLATGETADAKW